MEEDHGGTVPPEVTDHFTRHRELLSSVAYNMLGTVTDTEDVLQEVWVAWAVRHSSPDPAPVDDVRAYLVRMTVNQCLARHKALGRRRETYVGPWLPEPVAVGEDASEQAVRVESLSLAMLVVLETLSPLERAVFLLGEVFGFSHPEIGDILGRSPASVRQTAHRARAHVRARRPRYRSDPDRQRELTERFVAAGRGGDLWAFMELLAPDVTLWADGGGKARAAGPRPVQGRERVARILLAGFSRPLDGRVDLCLRHVNGDISAVVLLDGSPHLVLALEPAADGRIAGVYGIANPDKLAHL